jgi:hypothetical protein
MRGFAGCASRCEKGRDTREGGRLRYVALRYVAWHVVKAH